MLFRRLLISHRSLTWRHQVVDSFDQKERQRLLYFVTNCDKPPLLYVKAFVFKEHCSCSASLRSGFKDLVPNFTIWDAGQDERYLPTVSKCENVLKVSPNFPVPYKFH